MRAVGPCSTSFTLWDVQMSHDTEYREKDGVGNSSTDSSSLSLSRLPQLARPEFQNSLLTPRSSSLMSMRQKT